MEIIFEDDSVLVINKPPGLLSIQDGYSKDLPTVKKLLEADFGRCYIVHRLDKDTSGIMVVARTHYAHRKLNLDFQNRQINKIYHAILSKIPEQNEFLIDLPLRADGDRKHRTIVDMINGKPANTFISIIEAYQNYALVMAKPFTGYTHQIRSHLSFSGYPILGDKLYGSPMKVSEEANGIQIERTALHAFQISFAHPETNNPLTLTAGYPQDFSHALSSLK